MIFEGRGLWRGEPECELPAGFESVAPAPRMPGITFKWYASAGGKVSWRCDTGFPRI